LQVQRAQPRSARRNVNLRDSFEGLAVGPGEGDGGIPRDTCGQAVSLEEGHLREALLDTFVHITEALLQLQHLLAHHREAEMAWLDDPRVHRPNRNLMDTIALDPHEMVAISDGLGGRL